MSKIIHEILHLGGRWALLPLAILGVLAGRAGAQDPVGSQLLTDAIYRGDGVIDLLKDVSSTELEVYLGEGEGRLLLGVDVNEDNPGNESSDSLAGAVGRLKFWVAFGEGRFEDVLNQSRTADPVEATDETVLLTFLSAVQSAAP